MRIADILRFDPDGEEAADLFMWQLSHAFTRHGDVKGLLGFGHPGEDGVYDDPVASAQTSSDAAVAAPAAPLTHTPSGSSHPHQAAGHKLAQVTAPGLFADTIELAGRRR
jgi:hypothetical protein